MILQVGMTFLLAIVLNYVSALFTSMLVFFLFQPDLIKDSTISPGLVSVYLIITAFWAIARQGFTTKTTIIITLAFAAAVAFAGAVLGINAGSAAAVAQLEGNVVVRELAFSSPMTIQVAFGIVFAGVISGYFTIVVTIISTVAFAVAVTGVVSFALTLIITIAVALVFTLVAVFSDESLLASVAAAIIAVLNLLFSIYVARQTSTGNEKFALIRTIGIALNSLGGTNFHNADLTDANFNSAILRSTNFNGAILTRSCWTGAKKLDRARVGNSILSNAKVRELLVTGNGYNKDYEDCNLRGTNLTGATLHKANLKRADLGEATLHKADLREANLTEAQALETDFTEAALTGACLEGWNIDHTTKLDRVDCQYVFLLEKPNELGSYERRPHHPDRVFAKGEFEKLYKKMINVVQILLRDGINQEAFREAFLKLIEEHPDISFDSIQSIEKKGSDVLVTLEVDESADKAKIEQDFLKPYEERVKQLEAENEQLKLRSADLKDIAIALANKPTQITQLVGDGKVNDQSQNFNVGGNFNATNSVVGLREISGNVTNAINQLSNAPAGEANLKELLLQLQAVLENADEAVLPETDKADALEEVKLLAEAAQKPDEEKKTIASKAMRSLQRIVNAIPAAVPMATTLVTEFNKLVPAIATLLGL
jgi:uncharacterized protein YjbI with pentapeptide repeats